jgi:hypothetical protein
MADKNLNFNIKVNNKELDLTKTSFKDFNNIIKQAKKDLQSLPISDPRYKVLQTDIKNADAAWKEMNKTIAQSGDEMDNAGGKVETYKKQIKEATDELFRLEQQFGKNSKEYVDQQQKIAGLRDAQEELVRTTQDLDDTLAAIPGPIGQIGSAMQQLEGISQNVGSAFNKLGISFKTTDGILKASGIGALVLLIATLVAAIVSAAKKSEPLQQAFAAIGDALGALMDAIKPVADFFINVFVSVVNVVSDALNGLASAFGGVNKGFKQQSLALEKELKFQKTVLDNFNSVLSANLAERLKIEQDYNTKRKEILDAEYTDESQRERDLTVLRLNSLTQKADLRLKEFIDRKQRLTEINKLEVQAGIDGTDNQRTQQIIQIQTNKVFNLNELKLLKEQNRTKKAEIEVSQEVIRASNIADKDKLLEILDQSYSEQVELGLYYNDLEKKQRAANKAERLKREREYNREDIALVNQRSNDILQLTTELIKDENARNLQAAKDALIILKEQHRKELEENNLAGTTTKKLKEKQAAEDKVAKEKIRLEQIQFDAYVIQQEIDKQNRLVTEAGIGTQEYFDARKKIIQKEFEQEVLLADGNQNKVENARTKQWKAILELDKEGIQAQIDQLTVESESLFEGTQMFYQKQRDLEIKNYELAQKNAQGNYEKLEALRKQHEKNMQMIDLAELQSTVDLMQRQADTKKMIFGGFFKAQKEAEETRYAASVKAAGDNYALIETLEMEHQKRMKDLKRQEFETYLGYTNDVLGAIGSFYAQQEQLSNLRQRNELDALQIEFNKKQENNAKTAKNKDEFDKQTIKNEKELAKQQDKIKEEYFYKNRDAQYAQAMISAFQSAISAYSSLAAIPVVGPALGAAAAAVALTFGIKQANAIKAQRYVSSIGAEFPESSSKPAMPNYGRNYEKGGMIEGKRHAEGGTIIEAEKGEAIITRGAVTMFGPMLSMMNQMGGGTAFAPSLLTTSYDKPIISNPSQEQAPIVVKSYVVSSDMTSAQEKQARLKDLSTL